MLRNLAKIAAAASFVVIQQIQPSQADLQNGGASASVLALTSIENAQSLSFGDFYIGDTPVSVGVSATGEQRVSGGMVAGLNSGSPA